MINEKDRDLPHTPKKGEASSILVKVRNTAKIKETHRTVAK